MNIAIIAACGIIAFPNGNTHLQRPTHVVAVQANSSVSSGTLKLQSVVNYKTESETTVYTTNVVRQTRPVEKHDAYVGKELVYMGSSSAAWTVTPTIVTNVTEGVTNIVNFKVHVLTDNNNTIGTWTNVASRMETRWEREYLNVTNVDSRIERTFTTHPFTNTVLDVTLASGKYSVITNLYIPAGLVIGSGTAVTNGACYLFIDK